MSSAAGGETLAAPTGGRLARNTLYSAVGELSNLLLFLLGFLAARLLAPVSFGEYSTAFAFVGLFRILPDFGMSYASTLEISREPARARRLAGGLLGFQGALSAATLIVCLGIGRALYDGVIWAAVVILTVDLLLKAVKNTLRWLLKALERFGVEAVSLLAERVLILGLGGGALLLGHGVVAFVAVFAAVRLVDTVALLVFVNARVVPLRPVADPALWRELLSKGLPFAYAGLVITLVFQVDAVLLEALRDAVEVGIYRAPTLVLEGLTLVPRILGYALIPTMAALHARRPEVVGRLYRRGVKYLVLAGLPVAIFGVLESDRFVALLFGPAFARSVPVSQVLLPAALFMFLSNFSETTLACVNRWRAIVAASTAALVLNVVLNLLWIPRLGAMGSAWATLGTEGAYFAMTAAAMARGGHPPPRLLPLLRPLLACAAFAAALALLRPLPVLVAGASASAVFAAATLLFGVWDPAERAALRELLRGRRPDAGALT
ncbi:MAG TPA: flippase [Vicinamibacteria bacterium]|nr:flippase [Vicinamibacteria bacterium]